MQPKVRRREETIRVDRNIVTLLSRSTYESFPRVLRELVSNAYDADATNVVIAISSSGRQIVVEDNGNGMTPEQFAYFLTIAATRRDPHPTPRYKRERIGQFGVGFLAAFPFCEELIVETSAAGSPTVITANLPSNRYLRQRRRDSETVEEIGIPVVEADDPRQTERHFTRITLKGLTDLARQYLETSDNSKAALRVEQLKWDLEDTLILDYPPGSPVAEAVHQEPVGMEVYLNSDRLYRNVPPGEVMETHGESALRIAGLQIRYVVTSPWMPVRPLRLRGLRIRVNNVGIGQRETFGLAVQAGAIPRLTWLSGDIYIDAGARDFLALDREGFTNTPTIEALRDHFRDVLRRVERQLTDIDVRLKEIEAEVGLPVRGGGPRPKLRVGSRIDLVEQNISDLTERGFTVERVPPDAADKRSAKADSQRQRGETSVDSKTAHEKRRSAVEIDRGSRTIRIYEGHPGLSDTIRAGGNEYQVAFENWKYSDSVSPAVRLEQGRVVVNSGYPLFNSRSHGRLFLRLALSVVLSIQNTQDEQIARRLLLSWVDEFSDLS